MVGPQKPATVLSWCGRLGGSEHIPWEVPAERKKDSCKDALKRLPYCRQYEEDSGRGVRQEPMIEGILNACSRTSRHTLESEEKQDAYNENNCLVYFS